MRYEYAWILFVTNLAFTSGVGLWGEKPFPAMIPRFVITMVWFSPFFLGACQAVFLRALFCFWVGDGQRGASQTEGGYLEGRTVPRFTFSTAPIPGRGTHPHDLAYSAVLFLDDEFERSRLGSFRQCGEASPAFSFLSSWPFIGSRS